MFPDGYSICDCSIDQWAQSCHLLITRMDIRTEPKNLLYQSQDLLVGL